MKTKKFTNLAKITGGIAFVCLMALSAGVYLNQSAHASITEYHPVIAIAQRENPKSVPQGRNPQSATTINRPFVELIGANLAPNGVDVTLCYQLPTAEDWLLDYHTQLTVAGKTLPLVGSALLSWETLDGSRITEAKFNELGLKSTEGFSRRCELVNFVNSVEAKVDPNAKFTISVGRLVTSTPEQPDCAKVGARLASAKTGITIVCSKQENGFSYEISQNSKGVSEELARQQVAEALHNSVEGPWVLEGVLK